MELKDLKKTWDQISGGHELDESQLHQMLSRRTTSLIERIDRNIKIGFMILFVLIILFAFDDFLLSPRLMHSMTGDIEIPQWLVFLGVFSNALILTTFIYFVIKYYHVKRSCDPDCELRETLRKIIETLTLYQRMFYLALATFMVAIGLSFISGLFEGLNATMEDQGAQFADIDTTKLLLIVIVGLVVLTVLVGSVFLFLRWGFRKLYGNYIHKLKGTLLELEEIGEEID